MIPNETTIEITCKSAEDKERVLKLFRNAAIDLKEKPSKIITKDPNQNKFHILKTAFTRLFPVITPDIIDENIIDEKAKKSDTFAGIRPPSNTPTPEEQNEKN